MAQEQLRHRHSAGVVLEEARIHAGGDATGLAALRELGRLEAELVEEVVLELLRALRVQHEAGEPVDLPLGVLQLLLGRCLLALQVLDVDLQAVALTGPEDLGEGHLRTDEEVPQRPEQSRIERVGLCRLELRLQLLVETDGHVGVVRRVLDQPARLRLEDVQDVVTDGRELPPIPVVEQPFPGHAEHGLAHVLEVVGLLFVEQRVHDLRVDQATAHLDADVGEHVAVVLRVGEDPALVAVSERSAKRRQGVRRHADSAVAP